MDILYFLNDRTSFIRTFYSRAAAPFLETMRLIDAEKAPYVPQYSEDDEPPFLDEWMEADSSLSLIGCTCISMLSDSLKVYFATWERQLGMSCERTNKSAFKQGFISGYRKCFESAGCSDWSNAPVSLGLLEQIVLARNDAQHAEWITDLKVQNRGGLRQHRDHLFFAKPMEREAMASNQSLWTQFMTPVLHIDQTNLTAATVAVEHFAVWTENQFLRLLYPNSQ